MIDYRKIIMERFRGGPFSIGKYQVLKFDERQIQYYRFNTTTVVVLKKERLKDCGKAEKEVSGLENKILSIWEKTDKMGFTIG